MKRLFTYLFLIVLLTTVSGVDNLIFAEVCQTIEVENNESEEQEESAKEISELQFHLVQKQIIGSVQFRTQQSTSVDYHETSITDNYITSAYHQLFVLHEQFLI